MSQKNTTEILYVTARQDIAAKMRVLKNIASGAEKTGEHKDIKEGATKALKFLAAAEEQLGHADAQFEGIVYLNVTKGKN